MRSLVNTLFLALLVFEIERNAFGWDLPSYTCESYRSSSTYSLDSHNPAIKLRFSSLLFYSLKGVNSLTSAKHICTSRVVSEHGTYVGIRFVRPYYYGTTYYTEYRRVYIKDDHGLDTTFLSNNLPIADLTSSTNAVNVSVTEKLLSGAVTVVVYRYRRDGCTLYDYKCPNNEICLNYRLINNGDHYDFCNTEGLTTTYKPPVYSRNGNTSGHYNGIVIGLIIAFAFLFCLGCLCCCCCGPCTKDTENTNDTEQGQTTGISRNNNNDASVIYTVTDRTMTSTTSSAFSVPSAPPDVTSFAPPSYDTLKFDSIEAPPSYEEITAKTNNGHSQTTTF